MSARGPVVLVVAVAFVAAACSSVAVSNPTVRGTATYRERIAMPSGAALEVTLEQTRRWRIRGQHLELVDDGGEVAARFEALSLQ